jgi:hypothetical protein
MDGATGDYSRNVFINCPFDDTYQNLFDAAVFTIQIAGFQPRCALEARNSGQNRLYKVMDIISDCRYGIHDISRTELSSGNLPRFNMPLELGLDLGCWRYGSDHLGDKRLLVMDRSAHRYQKFISDIAGHDIVSHSNSVGKIIRHIRDWLSTESKAATIQGGDYILGRYRDFRRVLPALCGVMKLNLEKLTFGDFSRAVRAWLEENEA